jgi:hypothetical protein
MVAGPLEKQSSFRQRTAYHEAGHATAALTYGIPIIRVTIKNETPHLLRGHYRAQHDAGLECMATLCLAGPAAEAYFCGSIEDGADASTSTWRASIWLGASTRCGLQPRSLSYATPPTG